MNDSIRAGLDSVIGQVAGQVSDGVAEIKPRLRGWLHLASAPLTLAAGVVLIALSPTAQTRLGSEVYVACSVLLFSVSAIYHRGRWSPRVSDVLRRLDHANIFLLIAGTYTPLSLTALAAPKSAILLAVAWGGALLGIAFRVFWLSAPRWLYVPIYVALGWAAVLYAGDLNAFDGIAMLLIRAGGLAYSLGALFYARKRPNPVPGVFGFHELFHACTTIAFLAQWVGILLVVQHPVG
jgi:hemolysin III